MPDDNIPDEGLIICNLHQLMDERQLSLAELCRLTGLSRPTVRKLKYNRLDGVGMVTVARLCTVLRVGVGRLFTHKTKTQLIHENSQHAEGETFGESLVGALE